MAETKIGAGSLQAMARLGLQELRNAASFEGSNVVAPTEKGMYGTAMASDVKDQRNEELVSELWSMARDRGSSPPMTSGESARSPGDGSPVPSAQIQPSATPGLDALRAPTSGPTSSGLEPKAPEMERE